ncbi:MAG: 50S ribosomal protein L29 [Terracidiphilus sp.]
MELAKIRSLSDDELIHQEKVSAEQLFRLRFQVSMGQNDGVKKLRQLRKEIAQIKTVARERELGIHGEIQSVKEAASAAEAKAPKAEEAEPAVEAKAEKVEEGASVAETKARKAKKTAPAAEAKTVKAKKAARTEEKKTAKAKGARK